MIIGIGGVSRAGKSTLADLLVKLFVAQGRSAIIFSQDDYVIDEADLPIIKDRRDWEVPSSIRHADFRKAVLDAKSHYDLVIAEGLLCFHDPALFDLMDRKIFVQISKETFLLRKREDLRWGSTIDPDWYMDHVWDSHQQNGIPDLAADIFVIDGSTYFDLLTVMKYVLNSTED